MTKHVSNKFWIFFVLNGLFFGGFLFAFFDSKPDETSSFILFQFYPNAHTDNTPSHPPPSETNNTTTPSVPTSPNTTSPTPPSRSNLTGPITPTANSTIQLWQYNSKYNYTPQTSSLDLLSMKQMKVTVVELYGTSSGLTKGGIIPIRSAPEMAICALNYTDYCKSKYPADVIDLLYAFAPIYCWDEQNSFPALYQNHLNFRDYMRTIGIPVVVLEAIYPGQHFRVTRPGNEPWEIQLKIEDSFYYRENLLNVAARKADKWEYLLWIDAHQYFLNPYWWEDSIIKLEKYGTVQLFQYLYYMRRNGNWTDNNVNYASIQYARYLTTPFFNYFEVKRGLWAGNAWGVRREVYQELDRILDECVSGWCDSAFNIPTFGEFEDWALKDYPGYKSYLMPWLENAGKVFGKYGCGPAMVRGNIVHFDHERSKKFEIENAYRQIGADPVKFNLTRDLYRDENYTIHSKEGSATASLYNKRKWK